VNISQAAKLSGLSSKTIRFYEQQGVIGAAVRAENGYRVYSEQQLQQLRFIKRARDLGFSLGQSRELLELLHNPQRRSAEVKARVLDHVDQINQQLEQLTQMRDQLLTLSHQCRGDDSADCPILDALSCDRADKEIN
jgi:MerR family copper efflux transcriptional regulator